MQADECDRVACAMSRYHQWPLERVGHEVTEQGEAIKVCTHCLQELKPVERLKVYDDSEKWILACFECEIRCEDWLPVDETRRAYVDPQTERISTLEARVAQLERLVASLMQERRQSPPARPTHDDSQSRRREDVITDKYRHLLG